MSSVTQFGMRVILCRFRGWRAAETPSDKVEVDVDPACTIEDVKEVADEVLTRGSLPICHMLVLLSESPQALVADDITLQELGIEDGASIFVKDAQKSGPPKGKAMLDQGLIAAPHARVASASRDADSAPVLRCHPFVVDSLMFTPFVVEFSIQQFRQARTLQYAHTYLVGKLSVVEFAQPPRFDSRWGVQAGANSGSWTQVAAQDVNGPSLFGKSPNLREPTADEEELGIVRTSIIPSMGWRNGYHYHVVLVAQGPFEELRGIAWAFKVRLRPRQKKRRLDVTEDVKPQRLDDFDDPPSVKDEKSDAVSSEEAFAPASLLEITTDELTAVATAKDADSYEDDDESYHRPSSTVAPPKVAPKIDLLVPKTEKDSP